MSQKFYNAIAALKEVKSVEEWNEMRDRYKRFLNQQELAFIDASGLITEVLGKDYYKTYHYDN